MDVFSLPETKDRGARGSVEYDVPTEAIGTKSRVYPHWLCGSNGGICRQHAVSRFWEQIERISARDL